MADHKLTIDSVIIIESLSTGEKKTGEMLCNHLRVNGREVTHLSVETETQFTAAIQEAKRICESLKKRAASHFEIHGSSNGFLLSSGGRVPWDRVKQHIINLNFQLKNHLLVTMAVCKGTWLLSIMSATHKSPFHSLVSSQGLIYEPDIERGFPVFYDRLFAGDSLEAATRQLNLAQNGSHFDLTTTENVFANVFKKYFSEWCSPEAIKLRAKNIEKKIEQMGVRDREAKNKALLRYKNYITSDQEPRFEKYREEFFMHNVYPENSAEFCPTYEEVMGKLESSPPPVQS